MKTGPGGWFVQTGCFVCHSIAALGVKSPAQIGPDLSNAVEDVQAASAGRSTTSSPKPTGTMAVVLSRQIILTPEQKADRRCRNCARRSRNTRSRRQPQTCDGRQAIEAGGNESLDERIVQSWARHHRSRHRWPLLAAQLRAERSRHAPRSRRRRHVGPRRRRAEDLRRAGRPRRVLHVLVGRSLRAGLRLRPAVDAPPLDDPGLHALPGDRLRLRRRHEEDARRPDLGRRASSRAVGDQRRLRRPLAVRQRDERPRRPHRPARLQDQADLRTGAEHVGQPRLVVRHAEHRVLDDGVAFLDPDPEGHRRADRQVRHRVQGRHRRREDRSEDAARCRSAGRS